jgi:hypothetical protein
MTRPEQRIRSSLLETVISAYGEVVVASARLPFKGRFRIEHQRECPSQLDQGITVNIEARGTWRNAHSQVYVSVTRRRG